MTKEEISSLIKEPRGEILPALKQKLQTITTDGAAVGLHLSELEKLINYENDLETLSDNIYRYLQRLQHLSNNQ